MTDKLNREENLINERTLLINICKRKQAEEALRLSEERFSKAFYSSPVAMSITSVEDLVHRDVNKSWVDMMGYSPEEAIGKTTPELGLWVNSDKGAEFQEELLSKGKINNFEMYFRRKNGEFGTGLASAEIIIMNEEPCRLISVTDITELRRMELEMSRLDRLNLVGEIAASIGHEIRNPMTTVRGYLQLLTQNPHYSEEIESFDLMIEELDRANLIITEFLSLAKNKMVEIKLTSLNSIINKMLPLVQAKAISREQHIKLELDNLPDLLLDNKEIRQLILNMINNGLESMPAGGYLTIKTFIDNESAVLALQDKGHGIDGEYLDKMGTPFFTTKEQGTGLGLAVCYRIANRHNAQINIETSSTGTTFYVKFPIPIPVSTVN